MRKAWVPLITVVLCLTSLRDSAWAQMRDGWEFQWQQMRMDVKGFDEHVGDVIHRRIVQTFNPPTIVDTFTRDPITLNMDGKNAFRADIRYRRQGWGGGVSGWFLSTSDSTGGRLTSPAPTPTTNSITSVVNTVSMWKETLPPVDNELEPLGFSPVSYRASGRLSTFAIDLFALRTLANTSGIRTELILGARLGRIQTHLDQGYDQRAFIFDYFRAGQHFNNLVSLSSTADADFLGAGPIVGFDSQIRWRRLGIQASVAEAFMIGNTRPRGVFTDIDDVTVAQSPTGPFLTCPLSLASIGCFSVRSDIPFSNPDRTFLPVTELNLGLSLDITRNISVGGTAFAAIWGNSPIPSSFTLSHAGEGPGLDWALEERTLRFSGVGVVVNIRL